jgi:hypothetical protein
MCRYPEDRVGETRVVVGERFLLIPRFIQGHWRWLSRAAFEGTQVFERVGGDMFGDDYAWVPSDFRWL